MKPLRIGVALTCFNRREKTEACLRALFVAAEHWGADGRIVVALTDDGSTDGTAERVQECFPQVQILRGSGSLYWAGGMRMALAHLYAQQLDAYLWLNDDTVLDPDALQVLVTTLRSKALEDGRAGIVVGSTRDATGVLSYGGLRRKPYRLGALSFEKIVPGAAPQRCDTHNGNVLLVSAEAVSVLGNLDPVFQHGMGDLDYGLRAKALGVPIWLMPGYAGVCVNDKVLAGSFLDRNLPLRRRLKLVASPKGLPYAPWSVLCRRHAGHLWPLHFSWPYARTVLSSIVPSAPQSRTR